MRIDLVNLDGTELRTWYGDAKYFGSKF